MVSGLETGCLELLTFLGAMADEYSLIGYLWGKSNQNCETVACVEGG